MFRFNTKSVLSEQKSTNNVAYLFPAASPQTYEEPPSVGAQALGPGAAGTAVGLLGSVP